MVLGFKGAYFITAAVVFTTQRKADAAHPLGPLLDATAHIITLPEVPKGHFVWRCCHFTVISLPLSPPALFLRLKASCLLFHSPMCLPQELPHFNINRMLHHAVAQTSPCCIAAEVSPAAAAQSVLGKGRLCFVFWFETAAVVCLVRVGHM